MSLSVSPVTERWSYWSAPPDIYPQGGVCWDARLHNGPRRVHNYGHASSVRGARRAIRRALRRARRQRP